MNDKPDVLFLRGIPDKRMLEISHVNQDGSLKYIMEGHTNLQKHLPAEWLNKSTLILDTRPEVTLSLNNKTRVVFNEIADADCNSITLKKAVSLVKQLPFPCINRPENIQKTGREHIFKLLQGIDKVTMAKTIRFQPRTPQDILDAVKAEGMHFPVIFREAGRHAGEKMSLLPSAESLEHILYAHALDGQDFYLIQYHDYAEQDIFRKHRLVVVDSEVFLRHLRVCDQWMIHRERSDPFMAAHPEYIQEEITTLARFASEIKPRIQPQITEIHRRIGLDYFGLDVHLDADGHLFVFECNAAMNIFSVLQAPPHRWEQTVAEIKQALKQLILKRAYAG